MATFLPEKEKGLRKGIASQGISYMYCLDTPGVDKLRKKIEACLVFIFLLFPNPYDPNKEMSIFIIDGDKVSKFHSGSISDDEGVIVFFVEDAG